MEKVIDSSRWSPSQLIRDIWINFPKSRQKHQQHPSPYEVRARWQYQKHVTTLLLSATPCWNSLSRSEGRAEQIIIPGIPFTLPHPAFLQLGTTGCFVLANCESKWHLPLQGWGSGNSGGILRSSPPWVSLRRLDILDQRLENYGPQANNLFL